MISEKRIREIVREEIKKFIKEEEEKQKCEENTETVHHMVDSTELEHPDSYSTWIDYWESEKEELPKGYVCPSCKDPAQKDFVGGHVVNDNGDVFICPVCKKCNDKYKGNKAKRHKFTVNKSELLQLH